MFKQLNGWSTAQLWVSRTSDRQKHFKDTFTHLHHAPSPPSNPSIQVAPHLTSRCDGTKSDHFWKIHLCVSLLINTKVPQHSKNTSVNILQLLKAIPDRHPFFICLSSYFERSLQEICFGCENRINIWVHVFVWALRCSASGNMVLTNKLFSSQAKTGGRKGPDCSVSVS